MKRLLAFVTMFWLSLAAAVCLWWVRTTPRRPVVLPEPEDGIQFDGYDAGLIRLLEDIRRGETSIPER